MRKDRCSWRDHTNGKYLGQWCSNVLRMLTPQMWLCRNLMDQVNRTALEQVAQVTGTNGTYRIALRSGRGLDELELALLPILPTYRKRQDIREVIAG